MDRVSEQGGDWRESDVLPADASGDDATQP